MEGPPGLDKNCLSRLDIRHRMDRKLAGEVLSLIWSRKLVGPTTTKILDTYRLSCTKQLNWVGKRGLFNSSLERGLWAVWGLSQAQESCYYHTGTGVLRV